MSFLQSDSLAVNVVLGLVAMAVLVLSSDQAVKRLEGLAAYFHLSTTFMGMTVVALATSIPEISAHLTASVGILRGSLDREIASAVVLGANIGSDVVQQTFILGLVVFLAGSLYFRRYFMFKSMLPMIGSTILCIVLGLDQEYSRWDGLILFGTFLAYTYYLYIDERKHFRQDAAQEEDSDAPQSGREAALWALIALASMALTVLSAQIVLQITEFIVKVTGIGGSLIGVLTLGVASALPELTTAISGVRNREHGIPLGTLIGSNITNPLVAIGGGALVSTYWVPRPLVVWDLPWETLTGLALFAIAWFRKGKLGRGGAIYLMSLYFVYLFIRAWLFSSDSYEPGAGLLQMLGWL
ncbi:MAG: sodium:calcium antiporter [Chloroflexi bacterium]|jgi:cation:H+ antiporter|nr:sodium:calcium antiporter [Chloroflexota bacterium]